MNLFTKKIFQASLIASMVISASAYAQTNLSISGPGAGADGSGFSNTKLVRDGSTSTYTEASGTSSQRVSVKWSSAQTFNQVIVRESGNNVTSWQLVNNDNNAVLASGTTLGSARSINLGTTSAKKINLIVSGSSPLRIAEIEVYNSAGGGGASSAPSSSSSSSSTPSSSSSSSSSAPSTGGTGLMSCSQANQVRGFASLGGGTTGGAGGTSVTVTTGAQLVAALASKKNNPTPLTIFVNGIITPSNSGSAAQFDVKDMQNVSILGVGTNALFDGIGINIVRAQNIIVRNVKIRYNRIGQKDAISIAGGSSNIWIDHNELHNSLDVSKDYYDELVSGKGDIDNITISYNYLHSSWKTSLWGSGDSNNFDRRVTFVGNHWKDVNSRLPLFRFGQGHIYNNYYQNVLETGINSRMGARIRIEGNYFENVKNPILSKDSSQIGYWDFGSTDTNSYINVNWVPSTCSGQTNCLVAGPNPTSTVNYTPPYSYSVLSAANAKTHVLNNAGIGKVASCF